VLSMSVTSLHDELGRSRAECNVARQLAARANDAVATAKRVSNAVERRRRERLMIRRIELAGGGHFTVRGIVAGTNVLATYRSGRLVADGPLWQTAETIVDVGDTFVHPERDMVLQASLDRDFLTTLLTLIRAMDLVREAEFSLADDERRLSAAVSCATTAVRRW
jgi:hypothetical protein